jgi:hypothetical protein
MNGNSAFGRSREEDDDEDDDNAGAGTNQVYKFGGEGDSPVTGHWNKSGTTRIGVYRNGTWTLDIDGNGTFDSSLDKQLHFGGKGYRPVSSH